MKNLILLITILLAFESTSQDIQDFILKFTNEHRINEVNHVDEFLEKDLSALWYGETSENILGIIGEDQTRIKVKFTQVVKNSGEGKSYRVTGKTSVKGNVCDFRGNLVLSEIYYLNQLNYGLDSMYLDSGMVNQGIIIGSYEFLENTEQKHVGQFSGDFYTRWTRYKSGEIKLGNEYHHSDSFMNNVFHGSWKEYFTEEGKTCHWGNGRLPFAAEDLDHGSAEFSPSEKYLSNGWENYFKAWVEGDAEALEEEKKEWWK